MIAERANAQVPRLAALQSVAMAREFAKKGWMNWQQFLAGGRELEGSGAETTSLQDTLQLRDLPASTAGCWMPYGMFAPPP